jgi:hypothetical protein
MTSPEREEPAWVCWTCGARCGRRYPSGPWPTAPIGVCGICGETNAVGTPRDFDLRPDWRALVPRPPP